MYILWSECKHPISYQFDGIVQNSDITKAILMQYLTD